MCGGSSSQDGLCCAGERVLQPGSKPREAAFGLNERAQAAADAGKLGTISDVILECLHNDPQMRPTAQSIVPVRSLRPVPCFPLPCLQLRTFTLCLPMCCCSVLG